MYQDEQGYFVSKFFQRPTRSLCQLFSVLIFALSSLLLSLPAAAQATLSPAAAKPLTLGVFAYRPKDIMTAEWQPLVNYLNLQMQGFAQIELRVLTQPEMRSALLHNELDLIFTNPSHFIELRTLNQLSGALATLTRLENNQPVSELGGVIIRRADRNKPQTLQDLQHITIAAVGTQFLGGYATQMIELKKAGMNIHKLNFLFTGGSHDAVVQAVLNQRADAGFIRSSVLESMLEQGKLQPGQLTVVAPREHPGFPFGVSTALYPEWAFVAHWSLPAHYSKRIAALLYDLPATHPAAIHAGIQGFTIPADYASVEELMVTLRIPPFDAAPEFGWRDIWTRYYGWLVAGILMATVIVSLLVSLMLNFRRRLYLEENTRELADRLAETQQQSIQQFRDFSNNVPGVLYQYRLCPDGSSNFPYASEHLSYIYGCTPEQAQADASLVFKVIYPADLEEVSRSIQHSAATLTTWHCAYRVNHPTLGLIWVEGSASPSQQANGDIIWHGYIRNITALRNAEARLRLLASVFDASQEGIFITDANHCLVDINPACIRMCGYSLSDLRGMPVSRLFDEQSALQLIPHIIERLLSDGAWRGELYLQTREGDRLPIELDVSVVCDESNQTTHHVAVFSDISERKRHQKELELIAYYDPLTSIPNRRMLNERLRQAVAYASRKREPLAVCLLDLDDFKPINDTYGHAAGDKVLIEVAQRLSDMLRAEDSVARLGGDEFVLLLMLNNRDNDAVFNRIIDSIRRPINLGDVEVTVSASLGISFLNPDAPCDGAELLHQADQATYMAKKAGRDCYAVYQPDESGC